MKINDTAYDYWQEAFYQVTLTSAELELIFAGLEAIKTHGEAGVVAKLLAKLELAVPMRERV